ncbi:uncharacterized protein LOC62_07G009770 [Vanrija pseudolonga]|uniref:Zn(2)-C6 fungal-type domain-containing protein n=1 Tax=Vanrija pseudolonga TaxID=143232 RepID=A0AAF0YLE1_9TREE|nr:hypothetical protein LOC62_07G009770 [Vanrija pseudolonga]
MRAACDACRLRKVKCVEQGARCAFCTSLDIQCTVTARTRKRRTSPGSIAPAAGVRKPPAAAAPPPPPAGPSRQPSSSSISTPAHPPPRPTAAGPRSRLLGVQGLTRAALDGCLEAFFSTVGRVFRPSLPQDVFLPRAQVALYHAAGLPVPPELGDTPAASKLLILAVACCGAPFSHSYAALAEPLYNHCRMILAQKSLLSAASALDAIDAVLLLSELYVRSRHAASGTRASPTTLDPLGKGTVVDLMFYHKLHIPLPDSPDHMRRQTLFWTVYIHDAIRSASAHTCYRIVDEDHAWPKLVESEAFPYATLTLNTRRICEVHLSARAKGAGFGDDEVQATLAELSALGPKLTVSIATIEEACTGDGPSPATPSHAYRPLTAVEQLFLLSMSKWLHVVVWVAVQENEERHPGQISPAVRAAVEAATMAACEVMARLAEMCTQYALHVHAPRSIRNHMASFTLFLVRAFKAIDKPSVAESSKYFALAETLNRGIRGATAYPDSIALADTLRMALYHASGVQTTDATRVAERGLPALQGESLPAEIAPTPLPSAVGGAAEGEDVSSPHILPEQPAAVLGAAIASAPLSALFSSTSPASIPTPGGWAAYSNVPFDPETGLEGHPLDWADLVFTLKECGFGLPIAPN